MENQTEVIRATGPIVPNANQLRTIIPRVVAGLRGDQTRRGDGRA